MQVKASCGAEACTARAKGKLSKVKKDKLIPTSSDLDPGETATLKLRLKACEGEANVINECTQATSQRIQVGKALDNGKNVKAKVTARATDAAGNVATAKRTIRLVK